MLKSSLCDYHDECILVSGTITVVGAEAYNTAIAADRKSKKAIFKNCALFTDWITEINNTQVNNEKGLNVVMPIYNLIEYSDNYAKKHPKIYDNIADMSKIIIWKILNHLNLYQNSYIILIMQVL